jgi:branched-chain amino acid transport system ATP-binding protein
MPGHAVLEARDVAVRFGGVVALDGVSLTAREGEICGLIGPNGAGKSTLFDVISGTRRPNQGEVVLGGTTVTARSSAWRARRGVRRTFQRQQVFGWLTVEDNVRVALEWRRAKSPWSDPLGRAERGRRARVDEVVEMCGLEPVRDQYAGALSIGLARMTELARAVVEVPRVLLLDEPTSGLDHEETELLSQVLRNLREQGCAIVLVEHDIEFVMEMSDRVFMLDLGRMLVDGTPAELRDNPVVLAAYGLEQTG